MLNLLNSHMILAVIHHELRFLSRLSRTWILALSILGVGLGLFVYYSFVHYIGSGHSQTIGSISPRFLVHSFGLVSLLVGLWVAVFLVFDYRERIVRVGIAESIDSRPATNFDYIAGFVCAYVVVIWLSVAIMCAFAQAYGFLVPYIGPLQGQPIETQSLLIFLLVDVPIAALFWGSLTMCVSLFVKNRGATVFVATSLWMLHFFVVLGVPMKYVPMFSFTPLFLQFSTDYSLSLIDSKILVTYLVFILFSVSLLLISSGLLPRFDGRSKRRTFVSGLLVGLVGLIGIVANLVLIAQSDRVRDQWRNEHKLHAKPRQVDVVGMRGDITIDPSTNLSYVVEYVVQPLAPLPLDELVVSINPALTVRSVRIDSREIEFTHSMGILELHSDALMNPDVQNLISFEVTGVPDHRFAYLDSGLHAPDESFWNSQLHVLGNKASIFDDSYVALMPGAVWLPRFGANVTVVPEEETPRDFFNLNVSVQIPTMWTLVGTGTIELDNRSVGGFSSYRVQSEIPVPEVAFFASDFATMSDSIEGVEFQLFLHKKHTQSLRFFDGKYASLRKSAETKLQQISNSGLVIPYSKYSLVEVPSNLRVYGGGPQMPSIQSLPSLMLLREFGLPTAQFQGKWDRTISTVPDEFRDRFFEFYVRQILTEYFQWDRSGGNIFNGIADAAFAHRTCVESESLDAHDRVFRHMIYGRVHGQPDIYSSYAFVPRRLKEARLPLATVGFPLANILMANTSGVQLHSEEQADRPRVWELAERFSYSQLATFDDTEDASLAANKQLKAVAEAFDIVIDTNHLDVIFEHIFENFEGTCFNVSDLHAATPASTHEYEHLFAQLERESSTVSAFRFGAPSVRQIQDSPEGDRQFLTVVPILNDGAQTGYGRVDGMIYGESSLSIHRYGRGVRVPPKSAIEQVLVTNDPIGQIAFTPTSISKNRYTMVIDLPTPKDQIHSVSNASHEIRPGKWEEATPSRSIVIDDLDPGCELRYSEDPVADGIGHRVSESLLRSKFQQIETDSGFPAYTTEGYADLWSRVDFHMGWGSYRKTLIFAEKGKGNWLVSFSANLPDDGLWSLDFYYPKTYSPFQGMVGQTGPLYRARASSLPRLKEGTYDIRLVQNDNSRQLSFRPDSQFDGWHHLGDFELEKGEVKLVISNETTGEGVYADAIRWSRKK